jgi:dTDP-4-amino-4,6-dideoxygalactose transaminase
MLFGGNLMKHPAYENEKEYWQSIGEHKNADLILNDFLMLGVSQILNEADMNTIIEVTNKFLRS